MIIFKFRFKMKDLVLNLGKEAFPSQVKRGFHLKKKQLLNFFDHSKNSYFSTFLIIKKITFQLF